MQNQKYFKSGNVLRPAGQTTILNSLPVGVYYLKADIGGLYLEECDSFVLPEKLYGKIETNVDRVINTFLNRKNSLGVLLSGEKGSGKSLMAKVISEKLREENISTIIVSSAFEGPVFSSFMDSIPTELVVFFDEFEKVYETRESQAQILSYLDGTTNQKRLNILAINRQTLNENLLSRPGRLFYHFPHTNLEETSILEYGEEKLVNKTFSASLVKIAEVCGGINFDILQALVEESNRYDEDPIKTLPIMNINWKVDKLYTMSLMKKKDNSLVDLRNNSKEDYFNILSPDLNISLYISDMVDGANGEDPVWDSFYVTFYFSDIKEFNLNKGSARLENDNYILLLDKPATRNFNQYLADPLFKFSWIE